jgi:hypothetical protein
MYEFCTTNELRSSRGVLSMLPRVFSVMVTQRRSGFESRNIRFEGPSSNM